MIFHIFILSPFRAVPWRADNSKYEFFFVILFPPYEFLFFCKKLLLHFSKCDINQSVVKEIV